MNSPTSPRSWLLLLAAAFHCVFALALHAQSGTGTVAGRVSEASSGRSLQGAIVRALGTAASDFTDVEGRFSLVGLPAGAQHIRVEYVGLDPVDATVEVVAGRVVAYNTALKSSVFQMETFTVREQARGQALAINLQKTASGIINIVSEETFGAMTDGNIGAAIQRLPGLSVDEGQDGSPTSINIRGVAGEYNSFQIDGNRVPTSGGSRSFDPRQLAADGVTSIEVIKAPTPDRDGDAVGGIVNVVSRSAFQRDGREVKVRAAGTMNSLSDDWGHNASLSYSDLFSVRGGERNLGVSLTVSSYDTDRYSQNSDQDWVQVTPENNPGLNLPQGSVPVWFMEANHWEYDTRETRTQALSGSIDLRLSERHTLYFRPLYSHFERKGIKFETDIDIDTRFQDAPGGRKTYAALTPSSGRGTPGNSGSRGSRGWIGTDEDAENDLHGVNIGGRHEQGEWVLTHDLFYSRSKNVVSNDTELNFVMEPNSPWFLFEYTIVDPVGFIDIVQLDGPDPRDLSQVTEGELAESSSEKTEEVVSVRLDMEREFAPAAGSLSLKAGVKYRSSAPEFDRTTRVYTMDETFPYEQVVERTDATLFRKAKYYDVYPRRGQDLLRTNPALFELEEEDTLEDSNVSDYDAKEETSAAYVMGAYERGIHSVIAGVRLEHNRWDNRNWEVSYLDGEASVSSVDTGDAYTFLLPGLHGRHELKPNLILRESYNRSYGRPRLSELTRGRFVDEDGNIEDGNPDLEPAVSDNFDIQLEYYTDNGGLYSVGLFYKDIQDFTFEEVFNFNELDANGRPIRDDEGDFEYVRPVNGAGAKNYGVELIARQRLYFLPGALRGLSVSLSATFTESDAEYPNRDDNRDLPLPGFSDYLFTSSVDYAWKNLRLRVDYRYRSDYVEGLGDSIESDEFYAAEERVDAEISYEVRPGLLVFATGTNLTERPQVSYQGFPQFVEDASFSGAKYTVGVEYSF